MDFSLWERETFFSHKDVIIVGGGFAGLWSAYFLKKRKPRLSITVVDKGYIPAGASTRNAGFACFGSVTELMQDSRVMGVDKMLELVEMRYEGLQIIRSVFKNKEIDFDVCGGFELISSSDPIRNEKLKQDIKGLNKSLHKLIKKDNVFRLSDKKIGKFGFSGVDHIIENKLEGYLHSGKLCQGLMTKVQEIGVSVLNSVEILNFETAGDKIILNNNQQVPLTCSRLVICTNAFANQLLPELDVVPARGQVLVTSEIPGLRFKGTFHYDEGFIYFRNVGKKVLLGGARNKAFEEETTTEMLTSTTIQNELERFLSTTILPTTQYKIIHRWSGIMGMSKEKMPLLKSISGKIFTAVGMGGMGVAIAPVIAEKVAKKVIRET